MSDRTSSEASQIPIALFVYRRHRQLARTLECLRDSGIQQLYVFSDGAKGEDDLEDVAEVRHLLRAVDWVEPTVIERQQNVGLSESIRAGLDSLFETHEAAIVIEDDVCVAPEFYEYARRALAHYKGANSVAGITGLRFPFEREILASYPYDTFLSPRFSSWAWATWRERWKEFCFDAHLLRDQIGASTSFAPEQAGADMPKMIYEAVVTGSLTGSWDVVCATNMLLRGQYFVTPTWNMVENTGLSEGTHFTEAPPWDLHWEAARKPRMDAIRFAPVATYESVLKPYRRFFGYQVVGSSILDRARAAVARVRETRRLRRAWRKL